MSKFCIFGLSLSLISCSGISPIANEAHSTALDSASAKPLAISSQAEGQAEIEKARSSSSKNKFLVSSKRSKDEAPNQIYGTATIGSEKKSKRNVYFLYGAEHLKLENYN